MVILIATATARALIASGHFTADQRLRSQADSVAAQDQDRLRGLSDVQLTQLESQPSPAGDAERHELHRRLHRELSLHDRQLRLQSSAAAYYKIISTVSWSENFEQRPATITAESILSRPVSGDLPVVVNDQTGNALSASASARADPAISPGRPTVTDASSSPG